MRTCLKKEATVLVLAKYFKPVVKGKIKGGRFADGGKFFVEPVSLLSNGAINSSRKVVKARMKTKIAKFVFEHSPTGYKDNFRGVRLDECLLAISKNLTEEQKRQVMEAGGAAFYTKTKMSTDVFSYDVPVEVTVFLPKGGMPKEIKDQSVLYRGENFTPEMISKIAKGYNEQKNTASASKAAAGEGK